jgi:hypothetical protein
MRTVTLLAKAHNEFQLKVINEVLKSTLEGLEAEVELRGVTPRGWAQIAVSGEDEKIALNYLNEKIGLCHTRLEEVTRFMTLRGRIAELDKNRGTVSVDIGVSSPDIADASISLHYLQAQVVDGRRIALEKIVELFGFCKNLPLIVKILSANEEEKAIEAMLAEKQLTQYGQWARSLLDRLIVLGVPLQDVESTLGTAECKRDIVNIESFGLFEHALVCKLGTDAVGLIPRIGNSLRRATFTIFNPRKILDFLGYESPLLTF